MENNSTQIYITTYKIVQEKTIPYIIYTACLPLNNIFFIIINLFN